MPKRFLGRIMDLELVKELEEIGVDACGENGEFHTFVFDGPIFKKQILIETKKQTDHENYSFLPLKVSIK